MAGGSFLDQIDARKGRWRDTSSEAKGISPAYYWTGRGSNALEVDYALDAHDDAKRRAAVVIELVDELGLEPPTPVEPLPEIDEEGVNLVTCLALVPAEVSVRS